MEGDVMQKHTGEFYSQLAYWYDEIFPVSVQEVDFIRKLIEEKEGDGQKRFLDVGCGTGSLVLTLSILGIKSVGVDLSREMIEQARLKSETVGSTPEFYVLDMHSLADNLAGMFFDVITCLGNTLVHVEGPETIGDILKQFSRMLPKKGSIVLQVLNYDKILGENITELPPIEAEGITFERFYERSEDDQYIRFKTKLNTPDTPEPIHQETSVYPVRRAQLEQLLSEHGFREQQWYSSFQGEEAGKDSLSLIVHASR